MSNYKHGDWYCKPANEAEAKEIIERAVASGANNARGLEGCATTYFYGVFNGCVSCDAPKYFVNGNRYTTEQVREKFPLPSEMQVNVGPHFEHEQKEVVNVSVGSKPAQWDGNGWPPVGTICDLIGCGITVEIIAHAENNTGMVAVFKYYDYNGVLTVDFKPASWFHPIKTEREQFVERVHDRYDGGAHHSTVMALAEFIYDALKSGNLKAPESDK